MTQELSVNNENTVNGRLGAGKGNDALRKLLAAWHSRNARAAGRVGTFSFMAATLTACVDGGSSSSDGKKANSPFSVEKSGDDTASVSGEFVFIGPLPDAEKQINASSVSSSSSAQTVFTAVSIVEGSEVGGLVNAQSFETVESLSLGGVTSLALSDDVTVVGEIAAFDLNKDGAEVRGDGNVWLLIGEEDAPATNYTAKLDIRLDGGDLTFDMPSDDDALTLEEGTVIDLGGGTLIVSDGKVFANAADVQLLNIGDVVVNSELVITYDQFADKSENPDFTVTGTGIVTVLVDNDTDAEAFFDLVASNPSVLGDNAPEVLLENSSLGVVTKVDLVNLIDSKLAFLSASIDKQIERLEDQLQAQIDGNDVDIARVASDLTSLQIAVNNLSGTVADNGTALDALQDKLEGIGVRVTDYVSSEVDGLRSELQGGDFDADNDLGSLKSLSDAISDLSDVLGASELTESQASVIARLDALQEQVGSALALVGPLISEFEVNAEDGSVRVKTAQTTDDDASNGVRIYSGSTLIGSSIPGDVAAQDQVFAFNSDASDSENNLFVFEPLENTEVDGISISIRATTATVGEQGADGVPSNTLYSFDNVAPQAPVITTAAIASLNITQIIAGTAEAGAEVTLLIEGEGDTADTVLGTAVANQNGQWSITASLQGENTLKATALDPAGNPSTASGDSDTLAFIVNADWSGDSPLELAASEVFNADSNTFTDVFTAQIAGYNPATIPLEIDGELTVEQAVAIAQAGLDNLGETVASTLDTLESKLQGFDDSNDFTTLKAVSDDLAALNVLVTTGDGTVEGSVAARLAGLQATLESYVDTAISDFEGKLQGFEDSEDFTTLQAVSDELNELNEVVTSLQDLATGDFGDVQDQVGNFSKDIQDLQSQIDGIVSPDLIQRNELDNREELDQYDSDSIRVELGEGDDFLNSSDAETEIVGGQGADTINLTYGDESKDTVIYQSVEDGKVVPKTTVTYSTDPSDYREGSQLNVTINGKEYTYTVGSDDGDTTIDGDLVDYELAQFAKYLSERTVQDPASTLVGFTGSSYTFFGEGFSGFVTRADLDEDGSYTVPSGQVFVSVNDVIGSQLSDSDGGNNDLFLLAFAKSAGDQVDFGQEPVFDLKGLSEQFEGIEAGGNALFGDFFGGEVNPVNLTQISLSRDLVEEILTLTTLASEFDTGSLAKEPSEPSSDQESAARAFASEYVNELIVGDGGALSGVTVEGDTLTFYGQAGEPLEVLAGGAQTAAIVNSGLVTRVDVDFPDQVEDWPTQTNGDNTTEFDRYLRVTIGDKEIEAKVVYDNKGQPDPGKSVEALAEAVRGATKQGKELDGVIADASATGTKLTLIGAEVPEVDNDAPTFEVDSAAIDQNGVQQETLVKFSNDAADYYDGGLLSVAINGVDDPITAGMVAENPVASVAALQKAIETAITTEGGVLNGVLESAEIPTGNITIAIPSANTTELLLTAATEAPDPLEIEAGLSFAGEVQTATFSLEDAEQYEQLSDGTWVDGAEVYFNGGKAYVTITPTDGGDAITVSAEMQPESVRVDTSKIAAGSEITNIGVWKVTLADGTEVNITNSAFFASSKPQTLAGMAEFLAEQPGIASADITDAVLLLKPEFGVSIVPPNGKVRFDDDSPTAFVGQDVISADEMTSQALVDEINRLAEANPAEVVIKAEEFDAVFGQGVTADSGAIKLEQANPDLPTLSIGFVDPANNYDTTNAFAVSLENGEYSVETKGSVSFEGEVPDQFTGVNGLVTFLNSVDIPNFAASIEESGDLILSSIDKGFNQYFTFRIETQEGASFRAGQGTDSALESLQGASLDENGIVTLTAADPGKKTFEISDVTLDYQGVKQLASFRLDDAKTYSELSDGTETSRGAEVYYEGGKAFVTIKEGADAVAEGEPPRESTVSVDMTGIQLPEPIVLTLSASDGSALSLDMKTSNENLVYTSFSSNTLDRASIIPDSDNVAGDTLGTYLDKVAKLEMIDNYKIVNGSIELTVDAEVLKQQTAFEPVLFSHYGNGGSDGSITFGDKTLELSFGETTTSLSGSKSDVPAIPALDPFAATSQALVDEINKQITGVVVEAEAPKIVIKQSDFGDYFGTGAFDLQDTTVIGTASSDPLKVLEIVWSSDGNEEKSFALQGDKETPLEAVSSGFDLGNSVTADRTFTGVSDLVDYLNGLGLPDGVEAKIDGSGDFVLTNQAIGGSSTLKLQLRVELGGDEDPAHSLLDEQGSDEFIESQPDPVLSELLEGASLNDQGEIILTSKDTGKDLFQISDVSLDYQGVKQIATVGFSTDDADYYAGGQMSLTVDTTPVAEGGEVEIVADMVAGSASDSYDNLIEKVQEAIGVQSEAQAARLELDALDSTTDSVEIGFYVKEDGNRSDFSAKVYFDTDLGVYMYGFGDDFAQQAPNDRKPVNFIDFVNKQLTNDDSLSIKFIDGSLVLESTAKGAEVEVGLDVLSDQQNVFGGKTKETITATGTDSAFIPGDLNYIVGSVSMDESNGTLTLTSAEAVREAFTISDADITLEPVKQQASADFSTADADYRVGGEVGLIINGKDISVTVAEGDSATQTLSALKEAIETAVNAETDPLTGVESVSLVDGTLTLTASEFANGYDEIDISKVFVDRPAQLQMTEVDLSGIDFEPPRLSTDGGLPQVSVTVAGGIISAYVGVSNSETVENLAQAIDAATVLDDVVGSVAWDGTTITLTAKEAGADPLNVSDINYDVEDTDNSTAQQVEVLFYGDTTMDGLSEGSEVQVTLAGEEFTYTVDAEDVGSDNPSLSIAQGVLNVLKADPRGLVAESSVAEDITLGDGSASEIRIVASYGGPDVLGSVDDGGFGVEVMRMTDTGLQSTTVAAASESVAGKLVVTSETGGTINDQTGEGGAQTGLEPGRLVYDDNTGNYTYLVDEQNRLADLNVTPGDVLASDNEVTEGVAEGETEDQTVNNPSGQNDDFYGDAPVGKAVVEETESAPADDHRVLASGSEDVLLGPVFVSDGNGRFDEGKPGDLSTGGFAVKNLSDLVSGEANGKIADISSYTAEFGRDEVVVRQADIGADNSLRIHGFTLGAQVGRGDALYFSDIETADDLSAQVTSVSLASNLTAFTALFQDKSFLSVKITFSDNSAIELVDLIAADQVGDLGELAGDGVYGEAIPDTTAAAMLGLLTAGGNIGFGFPGAQQSFTNPANGFESLDGALDLNGAATSENGNDAFAGDAERSGSEGVSQTVTNPDSGYEAKDESPAENDSGANDGDDSLYGSDPGQYVDEGLETEFLAEGTDEGEDGVYENRGDDNLSDRIDIGDGSEDSDGGVAGESSGEFADDDAADDDFEVTIDDNGFAPFEWEDAVVTVLTEGNADADLVTNFQTDHDVIALEGELAESTLSGNADVVVPADFVPMVRTFGPIGTAMSLSDHEFGLVTSDVNARTWQSVSSEDIEDADAVASLLNSVYNFGDRFANLEDPASDAVNTTVFAVTASDDPDLTSIWAHTQSNAEDNTVEGLELSLLAIVETDGEAFSEQNFAIEVDGSWQQPEILQPVYE